MQGPHSSCVYLPCKHESATKNGVLVEAVVAGVGENWLAPTGGHGCPFPKPPPPLLACRDGAMTTGIHSPRVPPPTVVVFMSGLFRLHPIARGGGGGDATPHHGLPLAN